MPNHLFYGDNLTVLRNKIPSESVDLVYLDPPYNSNADYNQLFKTPKSQSGPAQMEAFTDTWTWDDATSGLAVEEVKRSQYQDAAKMLDAMVGFLGKNALTAYLAMPPIHASAAERLGYPTQKPVALLERIISASSNPGDVVLDPLCGCGTTVHAAQKLGRQWIGIDITHLAIGLIEKRLNDAFEGLHYTVHGTPMDADAARDLFDRDDRSKKQFETWACLRVGFIPQEKKGADGRLDGVEWFGPKKEYKAIVSVKGGRSVGVDMLRSLDAVINQQAAQVGVFLTLEPPTSKMVDWARQAGMFEAPGFAAVPRIQIVTVAQAIQHRAHAVNLPAGHNDTFKRAARETDPKLQGALDL